MGFLTTQQVNKYYDYFQQTEVTFTKEVIQAMSVNVPQTSIRYVGDDGGPWPCVINSASMVAAKVVVPPQCNIQEKLKEGTPTVNLRFSFFQSDEKKELAFFVTGKVTSCIPYTMSPDLVLVNIEYTQRAPDDLIEKIGILLDAKATTTKRSDDRIELTPDAVRKLGIAKKETIAYIENIPRRCILRDISFSGAKFIVAGIAPFLLNKDCALKFEFEDPTVVIGLRGKIIRAELVEGRKDLIAVAMTYTDTNIPLIYKIRLTQYFNQQRKIYNNDGSDT